MQKLKHNQVWYNPFLKMIFLCEEYNTYFELSYDLEDSFMNMTFTKNFPLGDNWILLGEL